MDNTVVSHFTVDKVLDKRKDENGAVQYKLQWHNKPAEESSWVPVERLSKIQSLLHNFDSVQIKRPQEPISNFYTQRKKKYFIIKSNFERIRKTRKQNEKSFPAMSESMEEESEFYSEYSFYNLPFFIHRNLPTDLKVYTTPKEKPTTPQNQTSSTIPNSKKPAPEAIDKDKIIDLPLYGNFSFGDFPEKVMECVYRDNVFYFKVEWKPRKNGYKPYPTFVSNEELKENDPKFLISFYESKIRVIKQYN